MLIETPADLRKIPGSFDGQPDIWIFREDSFDPVSRVRRGRLFQKFGTSGSECTHVEAHPAIHSDLSTLASGRRLTKELSTYIDCGALLAKPNRGEGLKLAIGVSGAYSIWKIVQTERTLNMDVMVTLRAESAFGILPEADTTRIPPDSLAHVQQAIGRVLDAAYRELPTSVVDQCRNAATVIISRWMHQLAGAEKVIEQDLGQWIKEVQKRFASPTTAKVALCSALEIINRLHPRGKDNEVQRLKLRPVSDSDAELAVHAVGFVLREVGWAKQ